MPRYNRDRMTLNTVGFQPAVFNPMEYKPIEQDFNILERAMAKQEERKQNALKQQSAIKAAISEVDLDASEDEWKQQYIDNINNQINTAAEVGDYGGALDMAIKLAGDATIDPALRGRERYNKERKEFLEQLETKRSKGLISDDSYERAIAQNVYNYRDIKDENGRITGGSRWTPEFNPLNDIDLGTVLAEMQQFMGISSETTGGGGGATQEYYDAQGNVTKDPSKAVSVRSITKGGSRTESTKEVTEDDWRRAYDAYIARHPEDEARLNQLWDNARYNFARLTVEANNENLTNEERASAQKRADNYWNNLTDDQGGLITKDDWLLKQISPSFGVMAYRQHSLVTEAGSTLIDEATLKNRVVANVMFKNNMTNAELYAQGFTMEYITADANRRKQLENDGMSTYAEINSHVKE